MISFLLTRNKNKKREACWLPTNGDVSGRTSYLCSTFSNELSKTWSIVYPKKYKKSQYETNQCLIKLFYHCRHIYILSNKINKYFCFIDELDKITSSKLSTQNLKIIKVISIKISHLFFLKISKTCSIHQDYSFIYIFLNSIKSGIDALAW